MEKMNKIQNIVLGVVVLGLIVVGYWAKTPSAPAPISYDEVITAINSKLGALIGPDIPYSWFSFGKVREWAYRSSMLSSGTATTTACSFKSPAATSTLEMVTANVASSSSITSFDIGYSTLPTATTTILARWALASAIGQSVYLVATTTISLGGPTLADNIMGPSTYINVKVGANSSTSGLTDGSCKVKFLEL
jgi:hypothetical protein